MKKLLGLLMVMGALAASADSADSYLYWMVGNTGAEYADYGAVKVLAKDSAGEITALNIYAQDSHPFGDSVSYAVADAYNTAKVGLYASLSSQANAYTYAIELLNSDSSFLAQTMGGSADGWYTYDQIAQFVISSPMSSMMAPLTGGAYAVPEPNSAMLMLIGCAVLGLKRKKFQKV